MLPVIDDNADGITQISEFRDERVIWISEFGDGGDLGRSLCLDVAGHLWAGTYTGREYWKFDQNGVLLVGPIPTNATNYGCAVDASGTLWGATLNSTLVELDTNTNTWTQNIAGQTNYGVTIGNDRVYLGNILHGYDPVTGVFQFSVASAGTGVQVDGLDNVWFGTPTLRKFETNVTGDLNTIPLCSVATLGARGPIVGKGNHIWTINTGSNSVSQYDNDCNFISTVPVGRAPYTYSDATGFGARNQTDPTGIWTVITDSGTAGTEWDSVSWNTEPEGSEPAGTSIEVEVRSSDIEANLGLLAYTSVLNSVASLGKVGRFIQVRATLRPDSGANSPVLSDLSVSTTDSICDVDLDGDIDKLDLRVISRARGQIALPNDPRDANFDGVISPADVKRCIPLCTLANCAIQ
jgi:streptogramin lyase